MFGSAFGEGLNAKPDLSEPEPMVQVQVQGKSLN
jgi:hypothetical protein